MLDVRLIFLPFLFTNYFWLPSPPSPNTHTNNMGSRWQNDSWLFEYARLTLWLTLPPTHVRCSAHFFAISFHKLFLASLPPLVTQTPPIFYFFVVHVQCTYYVRHSVLRTIFEEQEQDTIPLRAAGTYEGGHEDWSPPCFQGWRKKKWWYYSS